MKTIFGDPEVEAGLYQHYQQLRPYVDPMCPKEKTAERQTLRKKRN